MADKHSLWKFVFDGPHPDDPGVKEKYDILYEKVKALSKVDAAIMKDSYSELLMTMDDHGH
ncbi:MAG: hypothetical protein V4543_11310 [Bacteroidota bacterium]